MCAHVLISSPLIAQNLQNGLVNGSVGRVVSFRTGEQVKPKRDDHQEKAQRGKYSSMHWADEDDGFEDDMSASEPSGDIDIAQAALTEAERAKMRLAPGEYPETDIPPGRWPVVEFKRGSKMLLPPMDFQLQNSAGDVEATRSQVPLILAWA